jgi:hypothetical protein
MQNADEDNHPRNMGEEGCVCVCVCVCVCSAVYNTILSQVKKNTCLLFNVDTRVVRITLKQNFKEINYMYMYHITEKTTKHSATRQDYFLIKFKA